MKKSNFELVKIKCLKKGLMLSYTEQRDEATHNMSDEGTNYPHEDFINLLSFFKEPLAELFMIPEIFKDKVHITGLSLSGSSNKKAFIITGILDTDLGRVAINSPRIPFVSDAYGWIEEVTKEKGILDQLIDEIFEYFTKNKNAQLQLDFGNQQEEDVE